MVFPFRLDCLMATSGHLLVFRATNRIAPCCAIRVESRDKISVQCRVFFLIKKFFDENRSKIFMLLIECSTDR